MGPSKVQRGEGVCGAAGASAGCETPSVPGTATTACAAANTHYHEHLIAPAAQVAAALEHVAAAAGEEVTLGSYPVRCGSSGGLLCDSPCLLSYAFSSAF